MNKRLACTLLALIIGQTSYADSSEFPHRTATFQRTTTGPMMEIRSDVYVQYSKDIAKHLEAEWRVQKTPMGTERSFILHKDGFIHTLALDTRACTKTDISKLSEEMFQGGDPREFAESMKKEMGFKEAGPCEGAGLKGIKLTSQFMTMCMYKDVFLLWQETMGGSTKVSKLTFDKPLPKDKITLPAKVTCTDAPAFDDMFGRSANAPAEATGQGNTTPEDASPQEMPNMEEAMQQAKDAMKKLQEMMQQSEQ